MRNNHLESRQRCLESAFSTLNEMSKLNWQQSKWIKLLQSHTLGSTCLPGGRSMYQGPGNIKSSMVNCMDPHDGTAGHRIRQPTSNQLTAYSSSLAQLWGKFAENPSFSPHVSTTRDRGVSFKSFNHLPHQIEIYKNCPIQCSYHLCLPFPSDSGPKICRATGMGRSGAA